MGRYLLGIDVGSTTAKVALVDPQKRLRFAEYRRHFAEQGNCVRDLLTLVAEQYPDAEFKTAVCGSGARPIADLLGVDFVQEVVANSIAIKHLHPEARTAIELGGQDAKVIFFHFDENSQQLIASDMRMNGVCAGGTGAFIDEIAQLLQIPVEEFNAHAERAKRAHQVSGRCGVFAKTDIQPLLNQGIPREELAVSTLYAVARQTIGGLAQGTTIRAPVVFEGGPLTFNPRLIAAFADLLGLEENDIIVPEKPEVTVAWGCALATAVLLRDEAEWHTADELLQRMRGRAGSLRLDTVDADQPFFDNDAEREDFFARQLRPGEIRNIPAGRDQLDVWIGIDSGSTTSKFVFLDGHGTPIYSYYSNNKGQPLKVLGEALIAAREHAKGRGTKLKVLGVGTTGYGEELAAAAFHADYHTVETVAHARAALEYQPDASFVLDIGGQDMKAIFVNGGVITGITLNEACSSGCGAFIETFAQSLGVPVEDIAGRAFNSANPAQLGSRCTVFMRSRVITELKNGKSADDILAGLCRSIIKNVFTKVIRLHNLEALGDKIVVQGGTFRNDAILRAMELHTGHEVTRAPYAELMGAIGAGLLTKEKQAGEQPSTFIGLDKLETLDYVEESGQHCPFCANHCNRTIVHFADGTHYVQGNRCERGEIVGDPNDRAIKQQAMAATRRIMSVPNLVEERERLVFKNYPVDPLCEPRGITIGIPRALDTWNRMPFWRGLFTSLGFDIRLSEKSSYELYESALSTIPSDTVCFPAKLAHGHVLALRRSKVDRIFTPIIISGLPKSDQLERDFPCAVLHGYGLVLKNNTDAGIAHDRPTFIWKDARMREKQLARYFADSFGIDERLVRKAITQADACQWAFEEGMRARAAQVIADVEAAGSFAIVISMRPYQTDPLVNHFIGKYFVRLGVPVIPADALPGLNDIDLADVRVRVRSNSQVTLFAAAKTVARNPHLELGHIASFGCGHDAVVCDELERILQAAGKQVLVLKLDESDVRGPLRIRITSFVETVRQERRQVAPKSNGKGFPWAPFTKQDAQTRTVYVPNLSVAFSRVIGSVIEKNGVRTRVLPLADNRAIELGKLYLHNDICFPAQINVGEFLRVMETEKPDPATVALGMHQNCGACRAGQYAMLARKALDHAGLTSVPIVTSGSELRHLHPGFRLGARMQLQLVRGFTVMDALEDLRRSTRPYELNKGEAEAAFESALSALCDNVASGRRAVFDVLEDAVDVFNRIPLTGEAQRPTALVLGEILLAVHPSANYRLEAYLERHGLEVIGTRLTDFFHSGFVVSRAEAQRWFEKKPWITTLVDSTCDTLLARALDTAESIMAGYSRYRPRVSAREIYEVASPWIDKIHAAGEGWLILGEILHAAEHGVNSFVVVQPFGCMPNHIFGRGLARVVKEVYPHVHVLCLDFDPDTSMGNIENRLQMLIMNARELDRLGSSAPSTRRRPRSSSPTGGPSHVRP
jgi:predicted CoA-substrate-specific enzyme activase